MLGQTIFSGYISLAAIVLFMRHVFRASAVQLAFGGLISYYCLDPTKTTTGTQAKPEEAKSKKARKAAEKQQQLEIQGAAQQIYCSPLSANTNTLPFADDINSLAIIAFSLLLNVLVVLVLTLIWGVSDTLMMISVAVLLVGYLGIVLLKADYLSGSRKTLDKAVLATLLGVGSLLAVISLTWAPTVLVPVGRGSNTQHLPLLAWDTAKAARGLDVIVNGLYRRVGQRLQHTHMAESHISPVHISMAAAVCAGVLAGALLGPALQFSRLLYSSQQVPSWGASYMKHSWLAHKAMQLAFVTPILMAISQVPAFAAYWGISMTQMQLWAGLLLVAVTVTHCLAFRHLAQAYLNGGLLEWYQLLHNGFDFPGKGEVIRVRVDIVRGMLGKVGVQLMAPPVLGLSLGVLLLLNSGVLEQAATAAAPYRQAAIQRFPPGIADMLLKATAGNVSSNVVASVNISLHPANASVAALSTEELLPNVGDGLGAAVADMAQATTQPAQAPDSLDGLEGLSDEEFTVSIQPTGRTASKSTRARADAADSSSGNVQAGDPRDLWLFFGRFLGWWSCTTWSVYAVASLAVYRMGLNSGS